MRVIILTGNGAAFCAGYDQGQKTPSGTRPSDPRGKSIAEFIEFWQRNDGNRVVQWTHMWRLGKPIIAAVNGWAMGGGFWYQLAADITIASDRAVFAQPEVRHISNSTYLLAALVRLEKRQPMGADRRSYGCAGSPAHRHGQRGRARR